MQEIVVVGACRTAVGDFGGGLKDVPPCDLGAAVMREVLGRSGVRSEEHTSELQSLIRNSYSVFCLKKNNNAVHNSQLDHPTPDAIAPFLQDMTYTHQHTKT